MARRLRRHELKNRTVHLKIRYDDFTTLTRSVTLPAASNITHELWKAADQLLVKRLPNRRLSVRLLGMGVSQLEGPGQTQLTLFDEPQRQKHSRLDAVSDDIKARFGESALGTASGLIPDAAHRVRPKPDGSGGDRISEDPSL